MSSHQFVERVPTLESYWRSVILFGENVASYKFALGKSLLELTDAGETFISLESLAKPFARHVVEHVRSGRKQSTSRSSKFLEACQKSVEGEMSESDLIATTTRLGFANVIDAFHVVNRSEIPKRFFHDERKGRTGSAKGIRLTDELLSLKEDFQFVNLPHEIDARWRLVETAWDLNISRNLITVNYDHDAGELFTQDRTLRRVDVTSCRDALNGYQKGKCFYCFGEISVVDHAEARVEVDHFFPHALKTHGSQINLNGVWNLVLACRNCNRGVGGKSALVPASRFLSRLSRRNDWMIDSHHPLRETLILQTGADSEKRHRFLQKADDWAISILVHRWEPSEEKEPEF